MEFVWKSYGNRMEILWNISIALPCHCRAISVTLPCRGRVAKRPFAGGTFVSGWRRASEQRDGALVGGGRTVSDGGNALMWPSSE